MQPANYRRLKIAALAICVISIAGCKSTSTAIPIVSAPSSTAASSRSAEPSTGTTSAAAPAPTKSVTHSASPSPPPCRTLTSPTGSVTYGQYIVEQDAWNPVHPVSQTMRACTASDWSVNVQAASTNDGYTIQTNPDVHQNYNQPVSSLSHEYVSYSVASPQLGTYAWSIDTTFNNKASNLTIVSVWTDGFGLSVYGTEVATNVVMPNGIAYNVFEAYGFQYTFAPLSHATEAQGKVDLVPFWTYALGKGWVKSPQTLSQVGFGVNISDTGSLFETFKVSQFAIQTSS